MRPNLIAALALAPALLLPAAAWAGTGTEAEIADLKKALAALQHRLDTLEQEKAKPAAPVAAAADTSQLSADVAAMHEQLSAQQLKVDTLETAASTGPIAGLSVTGYVDPVYLYNRAQHSGGFHFINQGAGVYDYYNSSIGDVYLDIKKTFGVGPLAPSAEVVIEPNRGAGANLVNEKGSVGGNIFTQADVAIPLTPRQTVVVGLLPSLAGYETQPSNTMLTLTHNLLYDFSEPASYLGVLWKSFSSDYKYLWQVMIGNEQLHTSNAIASTGSGTTKTDMVPNLSARLDYTYSTALDLGVSTTVGRNSIYSPSCSSGSYGYQCDGTQPFGTYLYGETDLTYVWGKTQYNAQLDFGTLSHGAWNGGNARWYGVSLLAHRKWTAPVVGKMGGTLRFDYLDNSANGGGGAGIVYGLSGSNSAVNPTSGFGIDPSCLAQSTDNGRECKGARRADLTADLLFYPATNTIVKFEYRHDWASNHVFQTSGGTYSKNNDIFATTLVYSF
ncbi:DUF3138 family protein [Trinickia terrae]|uniref:DUF3138 family protein n=1 Tax=Trinickia terrae TaxID=2571161 RepID=A0A4U1I3V5_9BURK|nr:DUF3138 family protein [Trinickia terrae]TKC87934.1 DUF3138 family protein [Trinickia terrae]